MMSDISERTHPTMRPDTASSKDLVFAETLTRVLKMARDSGVVESFRHAQPQSSTSLKHQEPPALIDSLFGALEAVGTYFRKALAKQDDCSPPEASVLTWDSDQPQLTGQELTRLIETAHTAIGEALTEPERPAMSAAHRLDNLTLALGTLGDDRLVIGAHEYAPDIPNLLVGLGGSDELYGTPTTDIFAHVVGAGDGREKRIHGFQAGIDKFVALNNFQLRSSETVSSQGFSSRPGSWTYEPANDSDGPTPQWLVSYDTNGDRIADFVARVEADHLSDENFILRNPQSESGPRATPFAMTGDGEGYDSPLPSLAAYELLDGARKAIRTDLSRYLDDKGTAVNEHENYVIILGPRSGYPDDDLAGVELSDAVADKQRIFVLADKTQFLTAQASAREIFTIAAGGSTPDAEMVITGFVNDQDRIALVDLDGLSQPQHIVAGAEFTGQGAEWRLIAAPRQPGRWYANYDRDGDRQTDYTLIVDPSSGILSESDFLLAVTPDPGAVVSDYVPPTVAERLKNDMPEMDRVIREHEHGHGVIMRELDDTLLVLGNVRHNVLPASSGSSRPNKPTVLLSLDKLDEIICSDGQDVIAHREGFQSSEFDIVLGFESGVDKFAFLSSGEPGEPPQTVRARSAFTKANEWIYERFDEDASDIATEHTHPHYKDKIKSLDDKTWLVKFDADGDRKPDLMYLVTDTATLGDGDFLLNL